MKRIILITGGARSGKSTYAEKLALELSPTPVYLATARIWDEEFRQRVIRHQERRGPEWTKHRRAERTQPPPAGGTDRPDRLHHLMVYQLFLRPAFRYRPGTCRSKGRVRPLHGTRRNLHLCNQ